MADNPSSPVESDQAANGQPRRSARAWLDEINRAEKDLGDYNRTCDRIERKYIYAESKTRQKRKFQMLWANIQILKPSIYARCPKPTVGSRFRDNDPVSRVAATLLERALAFNFDDCDYDDTFRDIRDDYLKFARGVPRLRYEPTFKQAEPSPDDDAAPPDLDADEAEEIGEAGEGDDYGEVVDFERVQCDHVDRKDFIHPFARKWKEMPWIAYRAFLSKAKFKKRWPKLVTKVEFDSKQREDGREDQRSSESDQITIFEVWDKIGNEVIWLAKSCDDILEAHEPYLKLEGFYPSPRPAYGTVKREGMLPRPDYVFYQDQAEEIDDLTARIGSLTDMLKLVGFYPGGPQGEGTPEIEKAVRPGFENRLIAVKAWDQFTTGGGANKKEIIVWLPIEMVATIVSECVKLRKQLIDDVFQITGIADIMRGDTEAEETAAAQGLKSQWGSVRLTDRQQEMIRIGRDCTRMAGEIVANHFQISTLMEIANMPLPTDAEVQQMAAEYQFALSQFRAQQAQQQMAQQNAPMANTAPMAQQNTAQPTGGPPLPFPGGNVGGGPPAGVTGSPNAGGAGSVARPPPAPIQQPSQAPEWRDPGPTQEQVEALLRSNARRKFLMDIETDSTILLDEKAEQASRTQFIAEAGKFIAELFPLVQSEPVTAEFIGDLFMFGMRAFPAARELEESAQKLVDKLKAQGGAPKTQTPEDAKAQAEIEKAKIGQQTEQIRAGAEIQRAKLDSQTSILDHELAIQQHQMEIEKMARQSQIDMQSAALKQQTLEQQTRQKQEQFAAKDALSLFKTPLPGNRPQ